MNLPGSCTRSSDLPSPGFGGAYYTKPDGGALILWRNRHLELMILKTPVTPVLSSRLTGSVRGLPVTADSCRACLQGGGS
jgi:hypothetical protein